jgi:hypothetical protein
MSYDYSKKRSQHSQRRIDHWRFWVLAIIGFAVTIGVVAFTILR